MRILRNALMLLSVAFMMATTTGAQNLPKANAVATPVAQMNGAEPGRTLGKLETLTGTITILSDAAKTITLTTADGTPYDFKITRETKIVIDSRPAMFSDLAGQSNRQGSVEFVPTSTGNFARSVELTTK